MKRIILHIGSSKTGSSALQYALITNKTALEDDGIGYYRPVHRYNLWGGNSNGDFLVHSVWGLLHTKKDRVVGCDKIEQDLKKFVAYCEKYQTIIISEEGLWIQGIEIDGFWSALKEQIYDLFGKDIGLDVIIYLRRQDEWTLSRWKEDIRGESGSCASFSETLSEYQKKGYLNYEIILDRIEQCFGRNHIIVRSYDKVQCDKKTIIQDFFDSAGIQASGSIADGVGRINSSFSMNTTEALRLIKTGEIPCSAPWESIIRSAREIRKSTIFGKEYPMPIEKRRELLRGYEKGNRTISETYMNGEELFPDIVDNYEEWIPISERDYENARTLVKIAEKYYLERDSE